MSNKGHWTQEQKLSMHFLCYFLQEVKKCNTFEVEVDHLEGTNAEKVFQSQVAVNLVNIDWSVLELWNQDAVEMS